MKLSDIGRAQDLDHENKSALWQHPAIQRRARFVVPGVTY